MSNKLPYTFLFVYKMIIFVSFLPPGFLFLPSSLGISQGRSQHFEVAKEVWQKQATNYGVRVTNIVKITFKNASRVAYLTLVFVI